MTNYYNDALKKKLLILFLLMHLRWKSAALLENKDKT